jgi:hypothetical protein
MRAVKPRSRTHFSHGNRSAIELWKAIVLLKTIGEQLDMSKASMKRIMAFARANPENAVPVEAWKWPELQVLHCHPGQTEEEAECHPYPHRLAAEEEHP